LLRGFIALAAWSERRATADIILWVGERELDQMIDLIRSAGVGIDRQAGESTSRV
jgi:hypothetical protein